MRDGGDTIPPAVRMLSQERFCSCESYTIKDNPFEGCHAVAEAWEIRGEKTQLGKTEDLIVGLDGSSRR